jgi:hypothetical protein
MPVRATGRSKYDLPVREQHSIAMLMTPLIFNCHFTVPGRPGLSRTPLIVPDLGQVTPGVTPVGWLGFVAPACYYLAYSSTALTSRAKK